MPDPANEILEETEPAGTEEPDYRALYEQAKSDVAKWKAQSRKNESRAKANSGAATELEQNKTQLQELSERLSALEKENTSLKETAKRKKIVAKVANETGVPEAIVSQLAANDEESLTAAATAIAEAYKTPGGAPRAPEAGKFPRNIKSEDSEQREFIRKLFGKN